MMANGQTYLRMMADVLGKKEAQLKELLRLTREQEKILKAEEFDEEAFEKLIEQKDVYIKKIEEFDNGFQAIYNRVEEEVKENKDAYKQDILELQARIKSVTELGVNIQALEQNNKRGMEMMLGEKKKGIKQFKISRKTADKYYKNMVGMQADSSYFMDQKK